MTPLQFHCILKNGSFLELPPHTEVPNCRSTLYLVLKGKVSCIAKYKGNVFGKSFIRRSGEFFDIKLFNLFTIPVGFDNSEFHAKTVTATKLFCWNMDGIVTMRELTSPSLKEYWEYMVLRSLAGVAVRNHLNAHDTLYDSLLIPEHKDWLEGAPSRDFWKAEKPVGNWKHVKRQCRMIRESLLHVVPPHGVRQRPGVADPNPQQAFMELVGRTTDQQSKDGAQFRF